MSAPNVNIDGTWKNELTSHMTIKVTGEQVTGKYRTGVGAPGPTEEFDFVGFASGDQISFTVTLGKYGSLTSWGGPAHYRGRSGGYQDDLAPLGERRRLGRAEETFGLCSHRV